MVDTRQMSEERGVRVGNIAAQHSINRQANLVCRDEYGYGLYYRAGTRLRTSITVHIIERSLHPRPREREYRTVEGRVSDLDSLSQLKSG